VNPPPVAGHFSISGRIHHAHQDEGRCGRCAQAWLENTGPNPGLPPTSVVPRGIFSFMPRGITVMVDLLLRRRRGWWAFFFPLPTIWGVCPPPLQEGRVPYLSRLPAICDAAHSAASGSVLAPKWKADRFTLRDFPSFRGFRGFATNFNMLFTRWSCGGCPLVIVN